MVDIINLYENPWDIASSGVDTLPRGLNPYVYTYPSYPSGITDPNLYRPLFSSRLATLSDAISCVITEEINGTYTLNMTYPVDGNGAGLIKVGRIIAAKNYPNGSRQLFKITQISKTLKNTITVSGEHLSYDLSDYTITPFTDGAQDPDTGELRNIRSTLSEAIVFVQGEDIYSEDVGTFNPGWIVGDIYNRTPPYTEQGDQPSVQRFPFRFQVANTYYDDNNEEHNTYNYRNTAKEIYSDKISTVREFIGATNTGLLTVYGGEVIFNIDDDGHADVIFTPQMGMDRGFKVVYGKNLKSMNYKIQAGKQKSAWFPYYKYTMNSDLHINKFWEIDDPLTSPRALEIIGGIPTYEGQIKPPLIYDHYEDFESYVNIYPVDVTSEVDQWLKYLNAVKGWNITWGSITPSDNDQPEEAYDKSVMRSWALAQALGLYWEVNGTAGFAGNTSELTFDFASFYATDGNAVEADVRLGDTVTVIYNDDGSTEKKRVIKMEYDAATGRYKKITLSDPKNKRKTAAGTLAESSLNSAAAIDTAYANAASFKRDVLELVGEAFNSNLTVKTPLEKTYSVDSISKKPSMGLEIKGTTNDDGKCLIWRHNISDDTWSAVWEEVSSGHYTGQAPISISNQNVISLSYDNNHFRVNHGVLGIKNPLPAVVTGEDEDKYLYVDDNGYISWDNPPNTWRAIKVNGNEALNNTTNSSNFVNFTGSGSVSVSWNSSTKTISIYGSQTCLIEGTKILMANGTEKNIEDIERGDLIMSYDPNIGHTCEAIVLACDNTGTSDDFVNYFFDNGSMLTIFGKHCIYNKEIGTAKDCSKWTIGNTGIDYHGEDVMFVGTEDLNYAGRKCHYDLRSSNMLYFANGILNAESLTWNYSRHKDDDLPESFKLAMKADFDSSANLHKHQFTRSYGTELAPIIKEIRKQEKIIADNKKLLADSDYIVQKFTEGLIGALEWAKTKANRSGWRDLVNTAEAALATAKSRMSEVKTKYKANETRETRFNAAVARDNACLDDLKAYFTKQKI